jgi:ABC-type polysaccharide/polyol phosphate export permease
MPEAAKKRSSLGELIKGRWREFCREPSALFFVVLMPVLWMVILGFAFSKPGLESYGVGWDEDAAGGSAEAASLRGFLEADPRVRLKAGAAAALETWLRRGDVLIVVRPGPVGTTLLYDPSNRDSQRARAAVYDVVQKASGRTDPAVVHDAEVRIAGTRYIDFLVPGLLALSIMTSSLFGTGMTIVSNRRENLLKRYLATPMRAGEYIVSHIVGRGFVLAVELATVLIAAALLYRFRVEGNLGALIVFAALGAAAFTALALLCGSRTSNMAAMNGMTNLISLPMMLVSGVWFSRGNFPDWIAEPARLLPLTPLVDGLRRIALEGATLMDVRFEVAVLGAYLIICAVAAKRLFKWY